MTCCSGSGVGPGRRPRCALRPVMLSMGIVVVCFAARGCRPAGSGAADPGRRGSAPLPHLAPSASDALCTLLHGAGADWPEESEGPRNPVVKVTIRLGPAGGDLPSREAMVVTDPCSLARVRAGLVGAQKSAFPDPGRQMTTPFGSVEVEFQGQTGVVFWLSTSGFSTEPEAISQATLFFAPELVDVLFDAAIQHGRMSPDEMLAFRLLGSACR